MVYGAHCCTSIFQAGLYDQSRRRAVQHVCYDSRAHRSESADMDRARLELRRVRECVDFAHCRAGDSLSARGNHDADCVLAGRGVWGIVDQ